MIQSTSGRPGDRAGLREANAREEGVGDRHPMVHVNLCSQVAVRANGRELMELRVAATGKSVT